MACNTKLLTVLLTGLLTKAADAADAVGGLGQAFDRGDGTPFDVTRQGHARQPWFAVDKHRAASTGAEITATLHAKLTDMVAQNVKQNRIARGEDLDCAVVDLCVPDGLRCLGEHWDSSFADHLRTAPWSCLHPLRIGLRRYASSSLPSVVLNRSSSSSMAFRSTKPWWTRMARFRIKSFTWASNALSSSRSLQA